MNHNFNDLMRSWCNEEIYGTLFVYACVYEQTSLCTEILVKVMGNKRVY